MTTWTPESGHVELERDGAIAILRIARPDKLNALSIPMLRDLRAALAAPGDAAAMVLTGTGRAFSSGDDLVATEALREDDFTTLMASFQDLTRVLLATEIPVIAALNGIAVGGAAELALCCDARVGHPGADFLFPENQVGLTITNASSLLLPRLLGSRALPLVLDGERISGTRAHALGLLDDLVDDPADVVPRAVAIVRRWVDRGLATRFHLRLLRPPPDAVEAALAHETAIGLEAWRSGTAHEGIRRHLADRAAKRR
ncbi:MAG TPA: enoyl-CoA hydratase/isomerase family protein [Kofleriaceae bacterium]|nr:enoyl-CoA hydratase/isomerase family protein [Kofleriaceae bacterium]